MKRRKFLKSTGTSAITLPVLLNGMGLSVLPKSKLFNFFNPENDKVLVIIRLDGGSDGLNCVIPLDSYDNLANARPNVIIPESSVLKINDTVGFHPSMTGMKNMMDQGAMTVIHSVSYPDQNRSHFRSTDIWTSGSASNEFESTGWLGRYFDNKFPGYPVGYPDASFTDPVAITMGSTVSETCQGIEANFSLALNDPFSVGQLVTGEEGSVPNTPYGDELTFLRDAIAKTNAYSDVVLNAANAGNNVANYAADNALAQRLKNVALLISGGLRTKIYVCSLGGFDTHANQVEDGDALSGQHATLLQTLSDAIASFQEDLKQLGLEEKVVGMTFSEFGRQIKSNDSLGTDHGTAAPLFVFGSCINPGFIGDNPEIPTDVQPQEGVAMQYDFRNVYGSILVDWFDVDESEVKSILFDDFQHLPVINPCTTTSIFDTPVENETIEITASPNPFKSTLNFKFSCGHEKVRLSLINSLGQELAVLVNKHLTKGTYDVDYDGKDLVAGNYYYRIQIGQGQKTKMIVKTR